MYCIWNMERKPSELNTVIRRWSKLPRTYTLYLLIHLEELLLITKFVGYKWPWHVRPINLKAKWDTELQSSLLVQSWKNTVLKEMFLVKYFFQQLLCVQKIDQTFYILYNFGAFIAFSDTQYVTGYRFLIFPSPRWENILLRTKFLNGLSLCSSLNVMGHVLHLQPSKLKLYFWISFIFTLSLYM